MKAGFAEIDITPEKGAKKIGWMEDLSGEIILDPLKALCAVFENGPQKIAFIQVDTLSVRWTQTNNIRRKIEKRFKFPGQNIMLSATHNHAGPAVSEVPPAARDEKYLKFLENACSDCFGKALDNFREAELGFGRRANFQVAHNRRSRMRDGTVKSFTFSDDPMFLCSEGPVDPEVAVLAARDKAGEIFGCIVNYACHPVHHGETNEISAGFPGVIRRILKGRNGPALFINGAYGNMITWDFENCKKLSMEEAGQSLAADAGKLLETMEFSPGWELRAASDTVQLPYRRITDDEKRGLVFGAQRSRDDKIFDEYIDKLIERIEKRGTQPAEIQVLKLGNVYFAGIPAEYFVEFQLLIKEKCFPRYALTAGGSNGMIGYAPTREAFLRGGYETTLGPPSRMAPETGDIMAEKAVQMIINM